jgi:hypothetical protein
LDGPQFGDSAQRYRTIADPIVDERWIGGAHAVL